MTFPTRRKFLLQAASFALAGSTAARVRPGGEGPQLLDEQWRDSGILDEAGGPDIRFEPGSYGAFLAGLDLRHLRPDEVIRVHDRSRGGVGNALPPKSMWERIAPTLMVADEIRQRLGTPLTITSAYRRPAYNASLPGAATKSQHLENRALDLVCESGSSRAYEVALRLRDEGFFRGGIGRYPGFIHVDTRGTNATW